MGFSNRFTTLKKLTATGNHFIGKRKIIIDLNIPIYKKIIFRREKVKHLLNVCKIVKIR